MRLRKVSMYDRRTAPCRVHVLELRQAESLDQRESTLICCNTTHSAQYSKSHSPDGSGGGEGEE